MVRSGFILWERWEDRENGTNGINEERGDSEFREFKEFKEIRTIRTIVIVRDYLNGLIGLNGLNGPQDLLSAECYTRQKCHRWVVLGVRPIGGIFSRGCNRPLITTNSQQITCGLSNQEHPPLPPSLPHA